MGAGHGEGPLVCTEKTAAATERVSAHAAARASSAIRRGSPELPRWLYQRVLARLRRAFRLLVSEEADLGGGRGAAGQ